MATLNASDNEYHGFWGRPTSSIDWCEDNYAFTPYIAEFWNTLSNFAFVVLAMYGLRNSIRQGFGTCFNLQYLSIMVIGVGSALFHGTLRHLYVPWISTLTRSEQQCDETPMIWGALVW